MNRLMFDPTPVFDALVSTSLVFGTLLFIAAWAFLIIMLFAIISKDR